MEKYKILSPTPEDVTNGLSNMNQYNMVELATPATSNLDLRENEQLQAPSNAYASGMMKPSFQEEVSMLADPPAVPPLDRKDTFTQNETHTVLDTANASISSSHAGSIGEPEMIIDQRPPMEQLSMEEPVPQKTIKTTGWLVKWRLCTVFFWFFCIGWGDATPGPILSYIEDYYDISYAVVSLLWLGNALGFITIAASVHELSNRLGIHKLLALSVTFYVVMGAIVSAGTKFPVTVVGFYFGGLGAAIGLSQLNVYLTKFEIASTMLGIAHGSYGLGATISPIIATLMTDKGISWHYFYLLMTGFNLINSFSMIISFKGINQEMREINGELKKEPLRISASLKDRTSWLICLFILFYQGGEVALAGYIVSYLLDYRSGDKGTVGYVASGFWGGLTVGRFFLTTPSLKRFGARKVVLMYTTITIINIILTWVVPNLIAESVFVSIAGVFLGPIYPMLVTAASKMLPRKIMVVSLSLSSAFGSMGGSLFPFLVGLISQFRGAFIVLPMSIGLNVAMLMCWVGLPNIDRPNIKHWWERIV